jgi:hypothetical protein
MRKGQQACNRLFLGNLYSGRLLLTEGGLRVKENIFLCRKREFLFKHNTLRGSPGTRKTQPSDLFDIKRVVNRLMVRRDRWPAMSMVAAQMQCAFEAVAKEGGA